MNKPFSLLNTAGLEKALDASALRNTVISDNIANANSPGYQAKTVIFDQKLREAVDAHATGDTKAIAKLKPSVESKEGPVDIIGEMVSLSKNQILYHAYSERISKELSNLKWIVENAGR